MHKKIKNSLPKEIDMEAGKCLFGVPLPVGCRTGPSVRVGRRHRPAPDLPAVGVLQELGIDVELEGVVRRGAVGGPGPVGKGGEGVVPPGVGPAPDPLPPSPIHGLGPQPSGTVNAAFVDGVDMRLPVLLARKKVLTQICLIKLWHWVILYN